MVDYAYIPTQSDQPFMLAAKAFHDLARPKLSFVDRGKTNLQDILKWVDDKAAANRPGEVIVASHAWPHAMAIHFVPGQGGDSTYSRLVDLQPPSTGFTLPARYKAPPSDPQKRTRLTVKGCRIGASEPYMMLLKTLLGGELEVRAPRHYQYFIPLKKGIYLDFLAYSFELHRRKPIAGHQTLVSEFTGAGFKRYDTNDVPAADLQTLLDQLLGPSYGGLKALKKEDYLPDENTRWTDIKKVTLQADLLFPASSALDFEGALGPSRTKRYTDFRYEAQRLEHVVADVEGTSSLPTDAEVRTLVEKKKNEWEDAYGKVAVTGGGTVEKTYAEYLGLHPGEDLFTRIEFKPVATANGFQVLGIYYRYELEMPVTSVADGILFFTGRKKVGSQVKEQTNWPLGADFQALFRTV
jgi:hypothetical protein